MGRIPSNRQSMGDRKVWSAVLTQFADAIGLAPGTPATRSPPPSASRRAGVADVAGVADRRRPFLAPARGSNGTARAAPPGQYRHADRHRLLLCSERTHWRNGAAAPSLLGFAGPHREVARHHR